MSNDQLIAIQELIDNAMSSLKTANTLLRELTGVSDVSRERHSLRASNMTSGYNAGTGKVIEGIFDGQNMVDSDGQAYPIPANYASKSKLVEGDGMKLTITDDGKFMYKQIAPIERKTAIGVLIQEDGQYKVLVDGKAYRLLLASVTFYRAEIGDQVTIIIPKNGIANWGTVEAVLPKHISETMAKETLAEAEGVPKKKRSKVSEEEDGELVPALGE